MDIFIVIWLLIAFPFGLLFGYLQRPKTFIDGAEWLLRQAELNGHKATWSCHESGGLANIIDCFERTMVDVNVLKIIIDELRVKNKEEL